ncbi:MAG: methyl-accepting chemotaxis protein [Lachnospiraceae bacterium]|nr:methyl-accepting chemotaxis protein [Lachnospiraceae bacterium]
MKKKIFSLIVLPVMVLGIIVIMIALTVVKESLVSETEEALKSAATATLAAYDQNQGDYLEADNGDIWKGSYNISKSDSIVDSIKEKARVDVTFFYGDKRIMTSAKDKDGNRILGSPAGDKVKKKVLEEGQDYFSKAVSLDGEICYGYYVPVFQDGGDSPIGMIFVGTDKANKDAALNKIVYMIVGVAVFFMLVCILLAAVFTTSITGSLKKSIGMVQSVAKGDLRTQIDGKLLSRKDEIGDLSRAMKELQTEMAQSIVKIADNAKAVMNASGNLEGTARETTQSMREVGDAVTSIAESATEQAAISEQASMHVSDMGERIQRTSREMQEMKQNTKAMQEAEEQGAQTLHRMLESNDEVRQLVEEISRQTRQTNESAQKIKEATEIIASIADETSLLSLNASIEAARAGENGRGFAVVAEQIQKLAAQSNESSSRIEEIVSTLISDSNQAVATMEQVAATIEDQTGQMQATKVITDEVRVKLKDSLENMKGIEESVSYLDSARQEIIKTVDELSEIARQNAATTQEVNANTNLVTENFRQVEGSTEGLKSIADGLEESMQHFSV